MRDSYQYAAALSYERGDEAPIIAASGERNVAEKIVSIAKRFGIPIVRRRNLAKSLVQLEDDMAVPPHFFEVLAIIFNELRIEGGSKGNREAGPSEDNEAGD